MPRFESSAQKKPFTDTEEQFFAKGEKIGKASHLRLVKNESAVGKKKPFSNTEEQFFTKGEEISAKNIEKQNAPSPRMGKPAETAFEAEENKWFDEAPKNRGEVERANINPFAGDEPGSALVRNKKSGRVEALRADERFITLKEAYQYIADRGSALNEQFEAYQKSGLFSKENRRELENQQRALDQLQKEADDSYQTEAAKAARYSGSSLLIENPMFEEEDVSHELKDGDFETEDAPEVLAEAAERQHQELDELHRKRNELMRARDGIMQSLKHGDAEHEFAVGAKRVGAAILRESQVIYPNSTAKKEKVRPGLYEEVNSRLQEANEMEEVLRKRKGKQPVVKMTQIGKQWELNAVQSKLARLKANDTVGYPNELPGERERKAQIAELSQKEKDLSTELAPHTRANIGEALREILDELDDVQEAIMKQERNVQFIEKTTGKSRGSKKK